MTDNTPYIGVGKQKLINANLELRTENQNLLDLRLALMNDNRRLENELTTVREQYEMQVGMLKQELDIALVRAEAMDDAWLIDEHIQADGSLRPKMSETIMRLTQERDEARHWARRLYRTVIDALEESDIDGLIDLEKFRWLLNAKMGSAK